MKLLFCVIWVFLAIGCASKNIGIPPSPLPEFSATLEIEKVWKRQVGKGFGEEVDVSLAPTQYDEQLYAASVNGVVMAINKKNGRPIWKIKTKHPISGAMSANQSHLAFGTLNGVVIVLSAETGEQQWMRALSSEMLSSPAINNDWVIAQTVDGRLTGFDIRTGKQRWTYDTAVPVLTLRGVAAPKIIGDLVLAAFANGKLVALDVSTGKPVWEFLLAQPEGRSEIERMVDVDGVFAVADGVVYAVSYQGRIAALSLRTGRLLWRRILASSIGLSEFENHVFLTEQDSILIALDATSGEQKWRFDGLRGRSLSAPAVTEQYVVVGDYEGYLHWISQTDGVVAARVKVDSSGVRVQPLVVDGQVYVQSNSGKIAAYRYSDQN